MRFYSRHEVEVEFNGKRYPASVYLQALEEADRDRQLEHEVREAEDRAIQRALDRLTA